MKTKSFLVHLLNFILNVVVVPLLGLSWMLSVLILASIISGFIDWTEPNTYIVLGYACTSSIIMYIYVSVSIKSFIVRALKTANKYLLKDLDFLKETNDLVRRQTLISKDVMAVIKGIALSNNRLIKINEAYSNAVIELLSLHDMDKTMDKIIEVYAEVKRDAKQEETELKDTISESNNNVDVEILDTIENDIDVITKYLETKVLGHIFLIDMGKTTIKVEFIELTSTSCILHELDMHLCEEDCIYRNLKVIEDGSKN